MINKNSTKDENNTSIKYVSMDDIVQIMKEYSNYIIVDVRTVEEYNEGHIPNAICIPNETIGEDITQKLPNKEQLILIYCRSGNRSKQATEKLKKLGYTNLVEFGGIIDWKGEIVKENTESKLNTNEIEKIIDEFVIEVNNRELIVKIEDNSSAKALIEKLKNSNITIKAEDYSNFEKVGELGFELPRNDKQITTKAGDVILYLGMNFSLYYDTNSWNLTKLGEVTNVSENELKEILGDGNVTMTLKLK